ncbi:V-type ATP synthase subunit I [Neptunomonas japonica]|uniref:V-type H+-transporting ATPase subunit I n=1 Tax=Neptunomonas japonica JAMM 1380 TaxID=1441457 RepID=A0A7R6PL13_9GAMM|nr:V-type ATP synthase subunit I [Neptunomonas japonica]BBB28422.1 V-type H+-transporting ATPase subunit I [Neptunomonas japonica JAMM 1380]
MSILQLKKATLIGLAESKPQILDALQSLGSLHIIPLAQQKKRPQPLLVDINSEQLSTVLGYLLGCSHKRRQVLSERHFDLVDVVRTTEKNRAERLQLLERREFLKKRIKDLKPWGSFGFPEHGELFDQRLWFYLVPNYRMNEVAKITLPWSIVHRDNRHSYVAVIAPDEPQVSLMPVQRTHTGAVPLDALVVELEDIEIAIETAEAERQALTRWIYALQLSEAGIGDQDALKKVNEQTLDRGEVFAIQGWVATQEIARLEAFAQKQSLVLQLSDPETDETPPTLLSNPAELAGGEEVVSFFQTPGYKGWDPSRVVFFSFVGFFALIMSDAGYSLMLALILMFYWRQMSLTQTGRRLRAMGVALSVAGFVWGVMVGSYFGASPPFAWLASFKVMDLHDFESMMKLSICIGAGHLILGNLMMAWVKRHTNQAYASLGWASAVVVGLSGWLQGIHSLHWVGFAAALLLVVVYSGQSKAWSLKRFLEGLLALTNVTKMFGDILSYLRLFALGLASASLAITFNQLAVDVATALPAIGLLFKVLILITGHLLNFVLTVVSGVIHGLRLNLIEFYNWSLADEGYAFQRFSKQEVTPWIT